MKRYILLLIVLIITATSGIYPQTESKVEKKKKVQIIRIEDGDKEVIDTLIFELVSSGK